jgi:sulfatase maturation enzyme AslB (radical SAM superfamily)
MAGKPWCSLPFVAVDTNGTTARPCCVFSPKTNIPLKDYHKNIEIQSVRKQIINNIVPDQCHACVRLEKISGKSLRTQSNAFEDYDPVYLTENNETIFNLLIASGNICNLKCIHCNGYSSYTRGKEEYKINLINSPPTKRNSDFSDIYNLDTHKITMVSGEPFYDPKSLEFLRKLPEVKNTKNIELDINSNITNIKYDFLKFLVEKYKKIQIKASIDGFGDANDYLRFPSKWETIERSILTIKSIPEIELCVTTSVSNLSLLTMPELINWTISKGIRNHYFTLVNTPSVMSPRVLPNSIKNQLLTKFLDLKNNIDFEYHNRTLELIDLCINLCNDDSFADNNTIGLIEYLKKHDQIRGTNFLSAFPMLEQF